MTFQDWQLNSMTFQAWKMKFLNSMTFQVFHDLYEPCFEQLAHVVCVNGKQPAFPSVPGKRKRVAVITESNDFYPVN